MGDQIGDFEMTDEAARGAIEIRRQVLDKLTARVACGELIVADHRGRELVRSQLPDAETVDEMDLWIQRQISRAAHRAIRMHYRADQ